MIYRYRDKEKKLHNFRANINDYIDVGDVVFITNYDLSYSSYRNAFKFFGIPKNKLHNEYLNPYERSWLVMDMAIHEFENSLLLCLKNSMGFYMVINIEGVSKRNNAKYKSNLGINKNKFLYVIKDYDL